MEFSHHVGDLGCINLLGMFWQLAKFAFAIGLDVGIPQFLVYLIVGSRSPPCYVFIHEPCPQAM